MRRVIGVLSLGFVLAIGSVVAAEEAGTDAAKAPTEATAAKPSVEVAEKGWRSRLIPALQRLRLNPGQRPHVDRATVSSFRP